MASTSQNVPQTIQKNPLKLYIQDIYRATRSEENKYTYEMFGLIFKNVMLHGMVTAVYNTNSTGTSTNLEIMDPTGFISVYYNTTVNNRTIPHREYDKLIKDLAHASKIKDENAITMTKLINAIEKKQNNNVSFCEGDCVSVVGDIFVDDLTNTRKISAYDIKITSAERDLIWLEELRYLYEKFYLWKKE